MSVDDGVYLWELTLLLLFCKSLVFTLDQICLEELLLMQLRNTVSALPAPMAGYIRVCLTFRTTSVVKTAKWTRKFTTSVALIGQGHSRDRSKVIHLAEQTLFTRVHRVLCEQAVAHQWVDTKCLQDHTASDDGIPVLSGILNSHNEATRLTWVFLIFMSHGLSSRVHFSYIRIYWPVCCLVNLW